MNAVAPPKATRREWIGLAVLALACVLYAMDLTVLHLAVPSLSADLKPSSSQLLWIVDIYGFLVAGFLITMGTLGDRIGRRRLLLIGAAFFAVASVLAAFARTPAELIALRLVLGPRLLPEYRDENAGRIDPASVLLSLTAVLSLIYAVKAMAEYG